MTAKEILEKQGITPKSTDSYFYEQALKAMQEISDKAWEASQAWKRFGKTNVFPDKATFMKELFPETKTES